MAYLARWIRHRPELRYIPVIAVTAQGHVYGSSAIIEAGCDAVFQASDFNRSANSSNVAQPHGAGPPRQ